MDEENLCRFGTGMDKLEWEIAKQKILYIKKQIYIFNRLKKNAFNLFFKQ